MQQQIVGAVRQVILIHGMGRTPLSLCLLAYRLKAAGLQPKLFAYTVTFERWEGCLARLNKFINEKAGQEPYIVVTHSLGSVLARAVLPPLAYKPAACFFLAPPTQACAAACRLAPRRWYRLLTGEIGQLLADQAFMSQLPVPDMFTTIYAGNAGITGSYSPFGDEPNDGILLVRETQLPGKPLQTVPSLHTFIMNNRAIARDIIDCTNKIV